MFYFKLKGVIVGQIDFFALAILVFEKAGSFIDLNLGNKLLEDVVFLKQQVPHKISEPTNLDFSFGQRLQDIEIIYVVLTLVSRPGTKFLEMAGQMQVGQLREHALLQPCDEIN
jgi:hypothetical protein